MNYIQGSQIQWRGRTFNQVYSFICKNKFNSITNPNLFTANPINHYRREIASKEILVCNERTSTKIDILNNPNGFGISGIPIADQNGLVNKMEYNVHNDECITNSCILSPAENARRRVRSSGMIKRKFDTFNNNKYYTSTNQYLVSRNLSFQQNQYNFFRQGNSLAKPGTNLSSANVYSAQGTVTCKKYHITNPVSFKYIWIDSPTEYTVNIPIGYYDITDINNILQTEMLKNNHYIIRGADAISVHNHNIVFLLNIGFNNNTNNVELQVSNADTSIYSLVYYTIPIDINNLPAWVMPDTNNTTYTKFVITSTVTEFFGLNAGTYPVSPSFSETNTSITVSTFTPAIIPLYRALHYKPNNPQFGQQGAVSSSDLITRKKYNSITNSTINYRTAFGASVANALAYGVPSNGYTIKDKIGYPIKHTPTFSRYSTEMKTCSATRISNLI